MAKRKMKPHQVFPTLLIVLDVCAAAPYFFAGNWRMGCYWLFAAGLTTVVTF